MAYLALYRKWRPRRFSEVVGQKHISIPLLRAIEQDRLAHAYVFSGPRGTGKTSMAKILSKAVNCEHPDHFDPCNECENCREINQGSAMDVYEIDAASNRGIEEIRALKESVRTLPVTLKKKVYIIDEVHMLTNEAFDALLKTLEEPPPYVLFILATTRPEKIPLTILSRCQRYEFHRISIDAIKEHLLHIAKKSNLSLTDEAAGLIAVRADGGLRDALSLLDQCTSAQQGTVLDAKETYKLLGLTNKTQIVEMASAIFANEGGKVLSLFYDILQGGKEPMSVLRDLLEHFRNLILATINPNAPELISYGDQKETLVQAAQKLEAPYLDALFDYLHHVLSETKKSSSPRLQAEIGLLHLCRMKGSTAYDSMVQRVEQLEKEVERLKKELADRPSMLSAPIIQSGEPAPQPKTSFSMPTMATPATLARENVPVPAPQNSLKEQPPLPEDDFFDGEPPFPAEEIIPTAMPEAEVPPLLETVVEEPIKAPPAKPNPAVAAAPKVTPEVPTPKPAPASNPKAAPVENSTLISPTKYKAIWQKILAYAKSITRFDVAICLQKGELLYANDSRAVASLPQPFLVDSANNKAYQKVVAEAFQQVVGKPLVLRAVLKGSLDESEAIAQREAEASQGSAARPAISQDSPQNETYTQVSKEEIKEEDRNNPTLSEALKILPDCVIYEKN